MGTFTGHGNVHRLWEWLVIIASRIGYRWHFTLKSQGVDEDGSNGAGPWDSVQGSDTDSALVRQRELGGDRGDVKDPWVFFQQAARRIVGMTGKRVADGMWKYPPVVPALEAAVLYPIQE